MFSEGQDRSGRERRIPINVEPRYSTDEEVVRRSSARQQYQVPNNSNQESANRQWNHEKRAREDTSPRGSDHRQTSPNTSSINIDYRPPHHQAQRDQQYQEPRAFNSHNSRSGREHQTASNIDQHSNGRQSREQTKTPLSRDVSPNSDKKVNSPEPIPLPPPPELQGQTRTGFNMSSNPQDSSHMSEDEMILSKINAVKMEITNLLEQISQFKEISAKSKEYRFIDEMLTRCVLNLDKIECGSSSDMRQQRRATIKLVDQTTSILQRKLQINTDIHELTINMST